MNRPTQNLPSFRLARVLAERLKAEKSYYRLAEAITHANESPSDPADATTASARADPAPRQGPAADLLRPRRGAGAEGSQPGTPGVRRKHSVDRRKLQKIVESGPHGKNLTLTLKELHAINVYLEQFGEGLAHNPLFERLQILRHLAEQGTVNFLLASRPQVDSMDLSHWDVESQAVIQRATYQISRFCRFDQHDVLLRSNEDDARAALAAGWLRKLLGEGGPALVCIGSPRASHAAEVMLATMLGCTPFAAPDAQNGPPFLFAWTTQPGDGHRLPSCVAIRGHDLRRVAPHAATRVGQGDAWAMLVGDRVYVSEFPCEHPTKAYGIVAMQRRPSGQMWLVVAGLSGIGTYATAVAATKIQDTLPPTPVGEASPVLWAAVEAEVVMDARRHPLKIPRLAPNRPIEIIHGPVLAHPAAPRPGPRV